MNKLLSLKTARALKAMMAENKDLLDIDAARMGVTLTDEHKDYIVSKLKRHVRMGLDTARVKEVLTNRTKELIKAAAINI